MNGNPASATAFSRLRSSSRLTLQQFRKFIVREARLLDDAANDVFRYIESRMIWDGHSARPVRVLHLNVRTVSFMDIKTAFSRARIISLGFRFANFGGICRI